MKQKIRVLVVDDSALMRKLLTKILEDAGDFEVVGTAVDGDFALRKIESLKPDVITLDLEMPRMDGLTTLKHIVERHRLPVVLVSSHGRSSVRGTFDGLALGGVDFVTKPTRVLSSSLDVMGAELVKKVRIAATVNVSKLQGLVEDLAVPEPFEEPGRGGPAQFAVAIAVSTGGPHALSQVLPKIRPEFAAAILIVQHMPEGFTTAFAERLDALSRIEVREATDGEAIVPGRALVAPGGCHLKVQRMGTTPVTVVSKEPALRGLRPSADVLFFSMAAVYGPRAIGVVMTGMGDDGAAGVGAIRAAGGRTIAQDRDSSVVYGMPRAAAERGFIQKVLPLDALGDYLNALDLLHQGDRHEERRVSGG